MGELMIGLSEYFVFYNTERPHQALDNQTRSKTGAAPSSCG